MGNKLPRFRVLLAPKFWGIMLSGILRHHLQSKDSLLYLVPTTTKRKKKITVVSKYEV